MAAGQDYAAMINLDRRAGGLAESGQGCTLNQRATARGTPVADGFFAKQGVAMGTDPVHI
jgi:hypothetical protein